jgi:hypothetical protein
LIGFDKDRNLVSQWHIRCPCGLDMDWCVPWFAFPFDSNSLHGLNRSLSGGFLIVCLRYNIEILRSGTSYYKLFRKPSFVPRRVIMKCWWLVEYKKIYCLMFLWAVGLITHNDLYKVFLKKSFSEYLYYVNNFVKRHCVLYSKIVWNRGAYLSEDRSATLNL